MRRFLSLGLLAVACSLPAADDGPDIHLWPLVENARQEDGSRRISALLLAHRTTGPDGAVQSSHYGPFVWTPEFGAVLPLWYRSGTAAAAHRMLVPLWAGGPGYTVVPPLLSAGWTGSDGSRHRWATPLYHHTVGPDGRIQDQHALLWWRSGGTQVLLPLAYRSASHAGIAPLWFAGPDWWVAPPALSFRWGRAGREGTRTWLTPLAGWTEDGSGRVDGFHVGTYVHRRHSDVLWPVAWARGRPGERHYGVLPVWAHGPGYWMIPGALTGMGWDERSTSAWLTPLAHVSTRRGSLSGAHLGLWWWTPRSTGIFPIAWLGGPPGERTGAVLPLYWAGRDTQVLLPIAWRHRNRNDPADRSLGVLPVWVQGRDWWSIPALLTGRSATAGSSSTWVTPLAHRTVTADGAGHQHLGPWIQHWSPATATAPATAFRGLLPIAWRTTAGDAATTAILPAWLQGPGWWVAPPAMTGRWDNADGGTTTWVTPLAHRRSDRQGMTSQHAGLWWQGRTRLPPDADGAVNQDDWRWLVPLWYRHTAVRSGTAAVHSGLIPLAMRWPGGWAVPPALTVHARTASGGAVTWVTPLASWQTAPDGILEHLRIATWYQDRERTMLAPLWFQGPGGWAVPPALSWRSQTADGGRSLWLTPLFHHRQDRDGTTASLHAGPWIQGRSTRTLVPLWAGWNDGWAAPMALSGRWRTGDGGRTTWITPLYHARTNATGAMVAQHAGPWFSAGGTTGVLPLAWWGGGRSTLLPLWMQGRDWTAVPPLLGARWARADGGHATWTVPLAHYGTDASGAVTDWHVLNLLHHRGTTALVPIAWGSRGRFTLLPVWFQGPDHLVAAPLYYRFRNGERVRQGVPLAWMTGHGWWAAPPLLSAGWDGADGSRTTVATPLYHQRNGADGTVTSRHLLTWYQDRDTTAVAPLWWDWRTATGGRRSLLAPLWYQHRHTDGAFTGAALPLGVHVRSGGALDTSLRTQLFPFVVQRADDGSEVNLLWRLWHRRHHQGSHETSMQPLWWSGHRDGQPRSWQMLGGLVGHEVRPERGTRRSYALWGLIPLGRAKPIAKAL